MGKCLSHAALRHRPPETPETPLTSCPHFLRSLQRVMGEFFPTLLSLAQQLVRATNEGVSAAGAALFAALFNNFSGAYHQQVTTHWRNAASSMQGWGLWSSAGRQCRLYWR
jgi:hypothetical protein